MAGLSSDSRLQQEINRLKKKEEQQQEELLEAMDRLTRSVSPAGLLGAAIRNISEDPDIRAGLIDTAVGVGAGWIGKKLVTGNQKNIFAKVTGSVLQFVLSGLVSRKMHQVRKEANAG